MKPIGIRRDGETVVRFAEWEQPNQPLVGSRVELSMGEIAQVVLLPDQMIGVIPAADLRIERFLEPAGEPQAEIPSLEASRFDELVKSFPLLGTMMSVAGGQGMVISRDLRHGTIAVRMIDSGHIVTVPIEKQG